MISLCSYLTNIESLHDVNFLGRRVSFFRRRPLAMPYGILMPKYEGYPLERDASGFWHEEPDVESTNNDARSEEEKRAESDTGYHIWCCL